MMWSTCHQYGTNNKTWFLNKTNMTNNKTWFRNMTNIACLYHMLLFWQCTTHTWADKLHRPKFCRSSTGKLDSTIFFDAPFKRGNHIWGYLWTKAQCNLHSGHSIWHTSVNIWTASGLMIHVTVMPYKKSPIYVKRLFGLSVLMVVFFGIHL